MGVPFSNVNVIPKRKKTSFFNFRYICVEQSPKHADDVFHIIGNLNCAGMIDFKYWNAFTCQLEGELSRMICGFTVFATILWIAVLLFCICCTRLYCLHRHKIYFIKRRLVVLDWTFVGYFGLILSALCGNILALITFRNINHDNHSKSLQSASRVPIYFDPSSNLPLNIAIQCCLFSFLWLVTILAVRKWFLYYDHKRNMILLHYSWQSKLMRGHDYDYDHDNDLQSKKKDSFFVYKRHTYGDSKWVLLVVLLMFCILVTIEGILYWNPITYQLHLCIYLNICIVSIDCSVCLVLSYKFPSKTRDSLKLLIEMVSVTRMGSALTVLSIIVFVLCLVFLDSSNIFYVSFIFWDIIFAVGWGISLYICVIGVIQSTNKNNHKNTNKCNMKFQCVCKRKRYRKESEMMRTKTSMNESILNSTSTESSSHNCNPKIPEINGVHVGINNTRVRVTWRDIIKTKDGFDEWMLFLVSEFCVENMLFIIEYSQLIDCLKKADICIDNEIKEMKLQHFVPSLTIATNEILISNNIEQLLGININIATCNKDYDTDIDCTCNGNEKLIRCYYYFYIKYIRAGYAPLEVNISGHERKKLKLLFESQPFRHLEIMCKQSKNLNFFLETTLFSCQLKDNYKQDVIIGGDIDSVGQDSEVYVVKTQDILPLLDTVASDASMLLSDCFGRFEQTNEYSILLMLQNV